jgi:hypothetical protein
VEWQVGGKEGAVPRRMMGSGDKAVLAWFSVSESCGFEEITNFTDI